MRELCASLLAANHAYIGRDLKNAESCGIKRFHIDVTDGHYTSELTFGVQLVRDLRGETSSFLDAHLAVHNLPAILDTFLDSGADGITLQYECCELPQRQLAKIKKRGLESCLSFIPASGFDRIEYFMDVVDVISLLGVDPGIGGQPFMSKVLRKIETAANFREREGLVVRIAVDGGINKANIAHIVNAGADILILGSGIFSGDIPKNTGDLRNIIGG